jgi:hypothetical protein
MVTIFGGVKHLWTGLGPNLWGGLSPLDGCLLSVLYRSLCRRTPKVTGYEQGTSIGPAKVPFYGVIKVHRPAKGYEYGVVKVCWPAMV